MQDLIDLINKTVAAAQGCPPETGGCRPFYTPAEWRERGEVHGMRAALVVVHDGGDYAPFFNYDYRQYHRIEAMDAALREKGYYAEQLTGWYTGIYKI